MQTVQQIQSGSKLRALHTLREVRKPEPFHRKQRGTRPKSDYDDPPPLRLGGAGVDEDEPKQKARRWS